MTGDGLRRKIVDALGGTSIPIGRKQIAHSLGAHPADRQLRAALDRLVTNKTLSRYGVIGSGFRYRLSDLPK